MKKTLFPALFGVLAAGMALAAPPTVPELLRLVPAQARVVVAVDAAALRSHPAVQSWLMDHANWGNADTEAARFLADAGLDPLRDVTAMVVAVVSEGSKGNPIAFFAGRYDPAALSAALTKRGASPVVLGNISGLRLPEDDHAGAPAVFAQPSPELVVVGSEAAVTESLSATGAKNQLIETAVTSGQVDPRAPFWVVANLPSEARRNVSDAVERTQGSSEEPMRQVIMASGAVQRVAIQAFLDDSLRLSGVAVADTEENADLLRDAAKGVLAAARLQSQDRAPELVNVLRDVQVRAIGTQVTLASVIPVTLLEKLIAAHKVDRQGAASDHP
ncbi:MAG: hypothetical protein LAO05_00675 [Acidobacteriia bacterium]|nr:hypothetical protein [Terriglobia bacterium]